MNFQFLLAHSDKVSTTSCFMVNATALAAEHVVCSETLCPQSHRSFRPVFKLRFLSEGLLLPV